MIVQCVGSLVSEVLVLCILNIVQCPLCVCVLLSVFCLSSSVLLVSVFCQFFVTSSGPWFYCIPLNICNICSVPLSTQLSTVRSSNILQLPWYQVGGLAGHGTVSAHRFFFCSFLGQALPPFCGPATTLRSFVSQPRPQEVEQADQSLQAEVRQSTGRGASSCKNPSLVSDWD